MLSSVNAVSQIVCICMLWQAMIVHTGLRCEAQAATIYTVGGEPGIGCVFLIGLEYRINRYV